MSGMQPLSMIYMLADEYMLALPYMFLNIIKEEIPRWFTWLPRLRNFVSHMMLKTSKA